MMKKRITSALALIVCSTFASADWVGSVNYSHFSDKLGSTQSLDLAGLGATFGYRFDISDKIRVIPEARLGFGLGGDTVTTNAAANIRSEFEINDYVGVAVRGEYALYQDFYAFGVLSYQNIEVKVDAVRVNGEPAPFDSLSVSQTDVGIGIGAGWQINEINALEASYENIDGTDIVTVGYRFRF